MSYSVEEIYCDILKKKPKTLKDFLSEIDNLSEYNKLKFINSIIGYEDYDNMIVDLCYQWSQSVLLIREDDGSVKHTGSLPANYEIKIKSKE